MADRAARQTIKDQDGDITALCDAGSAWSPISKDQAIRDIESGTLSYYVPWTSGRREIGGVYDSTVSGGKYLRTDRDETTRNNLNDLPGC